VRSEERSASVTKRRKIESGKTNIRAVADLSAEVDCMDER